MSERIKPSKGIFLIFLVPITIFYFFTVLLPIFLAFYYSFFNWTGATRTFIGLENYQALLQDDVFWRAFGNNLYLVVFSVVFQIGVAFIAAMMLNTRVAKFNALHRTLCYFPATLSAVVIGFVWMIMYDYRLGLLNALLDVVGLEQFQQPWLSNPNIAMALVSIPIAWQYIGFCMIIFLAGFSSIDTSIFEMAEIDGANGVQRMIYIALPLMKKVIFVVIVLCISGSMRVFDHIFVMTGGGPGTSSMVMAMYAFSVSFIRHNLGYGNAISVGIFILSLFVILFTRVLFRLLAKEKGEI
jgi:raffinose/stachyose/melibiose transport system permease protein